MATNNFNSTIFVGKNKQITICFLEPPVINLGAFRAIEPAKPIRQEMLQTPSLAPDVALTALLAEARRSAEEGIDMVVA